MELDVYVPDINLALEYQGKQHYVNILSVGEQKLYSQRDEEKRAICERAEITLIQVPYWWDWKKESLAASISNLRPELF